MATPNHKSVVRDIPYTAKPSRGKTFVVVHKTHHSLENFRGASGPCHHAPYTAYTANDSRASRLATKPRKPCCIRHHDISLWSGIYHDISLTTGLYVKYTLVVSFDLRC